MRWHTWQNIYHFKSSRSFAWLASIIIVVISLTDILAGSPMKMISAFCFIASTASLAIAVTINDRMALRYLSSALSILVIIAGTITLIALWAGMRPGTARLAFYMNLVPEIENRMALISAALFILVGIALWLISLNKDKPREFAQILVIPVMLVGYVVPVRYVIGIHDFDTLLTVPEAINTAISFCLLGAAVLCFYPATKIMQVFTGSYLGSTMARRQLFGLISIPVVIGWLRITSERIHLLSSDMGVAFVAVAYTLCLIGMVWMTARSVNETDLKKRDSDEKILTEIKRSEAKMLKLNKTLVAIDKCSQAMVRLNDENSFLSEVCHVIIDECIYSMVWIGYALEDADKTVLPMVHFGLDNGYLESQRISWADTERGRGPTGTAIRTGKAVTCRNMLTDPKFLPWREHALKRGYASSIALPLTAGGKSFGALTIYSKVPDSFSEEEIDLLTELANDVAYGITAIRWKIAQAKAEVQLKKYAEDLKELNATKDKFFGIIAHDLKNPFTSILGASEILASSAEEFDLATIKKFAILLHNAGKTGYAMLENLLEWSRSQTGRLSFIPCKVNVGEFLRQDLDAFALLAAQKEITLKMSVPKDLNIMADLNMTHTILRNLLNNALKFTHSKGTVGIFATNLENEVIITISDNGIGISEEDQKKLFRMDVKFTRIGTAEERGTGLGLLLCKEFVEKQGGKIWVESIPGEGSKFKFALPIFPIVHKKTFSKVNSIPPED